MNFKIEEFSIGNYVKFDNNIYKICAITERNAVFLYNYVGPVDISLLEPVYIKDVIDKLDFKKVTDGGFDHYEIYSDEFMDVIMEEYTDGLYSVHVYNNEYDFPTEYKLLSSVHQLQNFLTMCNVNIKIEL